MIKSNKFFHLMIFTFLTILLTISMYSANYNTVSAQVETIEVELKFMTYNIEASGEDSAWKDVVKEENADIIVFVETGTWDDNDNELLNQYCEEFNSYFSEEEPYNCVGTEGVPFDTSGEAIFSRYPITYTSQVESVKLDNGETINLSHDLLHSIVKIEENNSSISIVASHLKCCGGSENIEKRENQQEGIINYMDGLGDIPLIYAGDLNSYSPVDTENNGDLGDGPVSMLLETSGFENKGSEVHEFVDVFRTLNPNDAGFTYGHQNSRYESRIDFIFANQYISDDLVSSTTGDTTSADQASDHYTVDTILSYDPLDTEGLIYTGEPNTALKITTYSLMIPGVISLSTIVYLSRRHK